MTEQIDKISIKMLIHKNICPITFKWKYSSLLSIHTSISHSYKSLQSEKFYVHKHVTLLSQYEKKCWTKWIPATSRGMGWFIYFISKLPNLKLVTLAPTLTPFMVLQEFLYHPMKLCKILLGECSIMSYITWWNVFIRAEGKVSFLFNEGPL